MASHPTGLYAQDSAWYEQEYQQAFQEFSQIKAACERRAFDGRKFVLVDEVTRRLREKSPTCHNFDSNLRRLAATTFLRTSLEQPSTSLTDVDPLFLKVFYILVDLQCPQLITLFHTRGLEDSKLPFGPGQLEEEIKKKHLNRRLGEERPDFYKEFCEAQYAWCPIIFEHDMMAPWRNQVIPFYRRERIQPYTNNRPPRNHITLWEVHVPEELIGPKLMGTLDENLWREQMVETGEVETTRSDAQSREFKFRKCKCYRFAIKQFSKEKEIPFEREYRVFRQLKQQDGLIQYIGWYQAENDSERTYNIILEYADFDLYTAFRNQLPPVSSSEIRGFYRTLLGILRTLDKIHRIKEDGINYDVWHGDIKPENILHVQQQFKLADPGEARIYLAQHEDGQSRAPVTGGTRTYAAPEKAEYLDGKSNTPISILQNSDVWSLGCVFSVAATYVVLGAQGILQYDKIRRQAMETEAPDGIVKDAFHNGTHVLDAVTNWHLYLRSCVRLTDGFTRAILDLVDEHILVVPAENRWTARQVSEKLENIMTNSEVPEQEIPASIEKLLQEISLFAEIECEEVSVSSSGTRIDSERAKKSVPPKRHQSDEQSQRIRFKSEDELLGTKILPTNQRTRERATIVEKLERGQTSFGGHYSQDRSPSPSIFRSSTSSTMGTTRLRPSIDTNVGYTAIEATFVEQIEVHDHPVTMWQVEAWLEKQNKGRSLGSITASFKRRFKDRRTSVRGLMENDPLETYYGSDRPRDIIYLVDNGSSMARHWGEASYLLRVLVWRSLGYDDDGMELYFTDPNTIEMVKQTKTQSVNDFVRAMSNASPASSPRQHGTRIDLKLSEIINDYLSKRESQAKEKPKTIIILTDGIWAGMSDGELEKQVIHEIGRLKSLHRTDGADATGQQTEALQGSNGRADDLSTIRPITIQFIAFGHDPNGISRMKRLDDGLHGYPDLIDMEPSNGDVYKMFLGSLDPKWDRQANAANNMVPYTPTKSPTQDASLRGRAETSSDKRASTQLLSPTRSDEAWAGHRQERPRSQSNSYRWSIAETSSPGRAGKEPRQYHDATTSLPSNTPGSPVVPSADRDFVARPASTRSSTKPGSSSHTHNDLS